MKRINSERIFEVVAVAGLNKNDMERIFSNVLSQEVSNSQGNRAIQLVEFITLGAKHKEFKWEVVAKVVELFLNLTKGMDKDSIKSVYRTFTTTPKFNNSTNLSQYSECKEYKNLNCEDKFRDYWGRTNRFEEYFQGNRLTQDIYLKLMVKIKKDLKKNKK